MRDPIGEELFGERLYHFVENDPISYVDMVGLYGRSQTERPIGPVSKNCYRIASIVRWEKQFSSFDGETDKCDCYCAKYEYRRKRSHYEQQYQVRIHCEFQDPCSHHLIILGLHVHLPEDLVGNDPRPENIHGPSVSKLVRLIACGL